MILVCLFVFGREWRFLSWAEVGSVLMVYFSFLDFLDGAMLNCLMGVVGVYVVSCSYTY